MASTPQSSLPLLYNDLVPLHAISHASFRMRAIDKAPWLAGVNTVPLMFEEILQASRSMPVVFSGGDAPLPLALMGLTEGVNVFVGEDGAIAPNVYLPAYVRRYPFLLAKVEPEADDLSLCFDPTSDLVGEFPDGAPLFEDGEPSEATRNALTFCDRFERAAERTRAFIAELAAHELLTAGEVKLQHAGMDQPLIVRGFQLVDQEKLQALDGEVLSRWAQSGLLPLLYAHLFSLDLMSEIFVRQIAKGA